MSALKLYTRFYGALHFDRIPYWVLSPLRRLVRALANKHLPLVLSKDVTGSSNHRSNLIVSFTSFPARIDDVWKVVECIKRQSILPGKIILWLSKDQFQSKDNVPDKLIKCQDDLFEIRYVDGDIRSHKKYYYTILEYPDCDFITCDDDVFYDPDMIKRLLDTSNKFPGCIVANHTSHIQITDNGELLAYSTWGDNEPAYAKNDRIQIGVGGVYYPAHSLHPLVTNKDLFMELAPLADDIWLNCMARLNHTQIVQSPEVLIPLSIESNAPTLSSVNIGAEHRNDIQINDIRDYLANNGYEDVYSKKL